MKEWHKSMLLALFAFLVTAGLLEGAARFFLEPVSRVNYTSIPRSIIMQAEFPGVPYQLRPNSSGKRDFGSNPDGYFDADIKKCKGCGICHRECWFGAISMQEVK